MAHLEYVLSGWDKLKLTKVAPKDIPQLYKEADVVGSCMSGKPLEYFEIYTKLESGGAYAINLGGEIVGRFLYHTRTINESEYIYIDRIYLNTDNNALKEKIYQHGSKYTPSELVERVTGGPMNIEPYIRYLRTKYGELYKL